MVLVEQALLTNNKEQGQINRKLCLEPYCKHEQSWKPRNTTESQVIERLSNKVAKSGTNAQTVDGTLV